MYTQSTRKNVGNNIYFNFSNDPTQLYGMEVDGSVYIKKIANKKFGWKVEVDITKVKTCGCCATNKTCGPQTDVTPTKTHYVFEYTEEPK